MHLSPSIAPNIRDAVSNFRGLYGADPIPSGSGFGDAIFARLLVTEASVSQDTDSGRVSGRLVAEIDVEHDMLNGMGNVQGGCTSTLIDIGSTLCFMAAYNGTHVSQSLNVVYHSPATLGDKLRIISTTLSIGTRVITARTEIWNATRHRLAASGVHIKMTPTGGASRL
ncbi:Acyl-coenzyme A thioesterase 13 [Mycena kentingensis (nom. inval.)]|nr:Acyl-coenzyme A thioesterase 13 [Mycena kentingensis (nom. inval.)]